MRSVKTEIAPFGAALSHDSTIAYVTNWGGRAPKPGDLTALAGSDRVVTDERGIASTGTVLRIDLVMGAVEKTIPSACILRRSCGMSLRRACTSPTAIRIRFQSSTPTRTKCFRPLFCSPFSEKLQAWRPPRWPLPKEPLICRLRRHQRGRRSRCKRRKTKGIDPNRPGIPTVCRSPRTSRDRHSARRRLRLAATSQNIVTSMPNAVRFMYFPFLQGQFASFTNAVIVNNLMVLPAGDERPRAGMKPMPVPDRAGEPSNHRAYRLYR